MEHKPDKQQTLTRLALCAGIAAALYAAALKLSALECYRPWLEEHKVESIAVAAAVLFGLSLVALPLPEQEDLPESGPCDGYERTEDLP